MLESCLYQMFRLNPLISSKGDQKNFIFLWVSLWTHESQHIWHVSNASMHFHHYSFFWLIVTPWPVGSLSDWLQSLSNLILIFSEDVQGSSCVFPTPDLGPAISLRSLGSFHWKMVFVSIWGIGAFQWCCRFPFDGVSMFLLCFHHPLLYFSWACSVDSFVEKCRVGYDYPALCANVGNVLQLLLC